MARWTQQLRWFRHCIAPKDDRMRLDRWFRQQFPSLPNSFVQSQIRKRKIRVLEVAPATASGNAPTPAFVPTKAQSLLYAGQCVAIDAHLFRTRLQSEWESNKASTHADERAAAMSYADDPVVQDLLTRIMYRDSNFLVVNKPHGLAVQGGSGLERSLGTFLPAIAAHVGGETPRLVHRLDKETSGLLVLARHRLAAAAFAELLQSGRVSKTYRAIVCPVAPNVEIPEQGEITLPIDGKPAHTRFERTRTVTTIAPKKSYELRLFPQSGRKHQLRIHCAEVLRSPILGDRRYGRHNLPEPRNRRDPRVPLRLHLHAERLVFPDPFAPTTIIDVCSRWDGIKTWP
ncbi:TPA: hypothetical protein N0F65_004926 [Lagenidium giganteum]|uniref:Pseudouridine synthase RsuA/RluA-like domain-containing protein n=1 Tax=Lagenidium giganteum TaxID=4803 RepID=A0AAV2Z193_9STRA|nr:TPA: hypothetical protein N0F65_004926 [Lagenidium giganteum]